MTTTSSPLPVAVLGAGVAGLTAATALKNAGVPVVCFEAGRQIAGLASSFRDEEGFIYDFGAHFITNRLAAAVGVGAACRLVRRYGETVSFGGRWYDYPLGMVTSPRFVGSAIAARVRAGRPGPQSAADWFRQAYGRLFADTVAIPLVEAWSGRPAEQLSSEVGEKIPGGVGRTIRLKLAGRLLHRAIAQGYCRAQPESYNVWHVYPEHGVHTICSALADGLEGAVRLESPVEAILVDQERVVAIQVQGREVPVAAVFSTAPVHILARLVRGTAALEPLGAFRYRPMLFINLRLTGRDLLPDVVTWTPEPQFPFFRLTEATQSMPWLAPAGKTMITVDIGCEVGDDYWRMADEQLGELVIDAMDPLVPGIRRRYLGCRVLRTPIAYPVFLRDYEATRQRLKLSTGIEGLYSVGRNGEFAHILMEDVYWRTRRIVWRALQQLREASAA